MRKIVIVFFILFITAGGAELFLRNYYGFCNTVLMREDKAYEYIAAPNQNRHRFRNYIIYNSHSMRNAEVDSSKQIILVFGDSVINGGVLTTHDSLATTRLTQAYKDIQFLNISAGSWGPDNCFAYLQKHGNFGATQIVLILSSHDAYDNMNFEKIVGVHKSFPKRQYKLATVELIDRYILPKLRTKIKKPAAQTDELGINKQVKTSIFNSGFEDFFNYSKEKNIPLTIILHANIHELKKGEYNEQGKEIIRFANERNIPLICDLAYNFEESDFRDNIHLSERGQKRLAKIISKHLVNNP